MMKQKSVFDVILLWEIFFLLIPMKMLIYSPIKIMIEYFILYFSSDFLLKINLNPSAFLLPIIFLLPQIFSIHLINQKKEEFQNNSQNPVPIKQVKLICILWLIPYWISFIVLTFFFNYYWAIWGYTRIALSPIFGIALWIYIRRKSRGLDFIPGNHTYKISNFSKNSQDKIQKLMQLDYIHNKRGYFLINDFNRIIVPEEKKYVKVLLILFSYRFTGLWKDLHESNGKFTYKHLNSSLDFSSKNQMLQELIMNSKFLDEIVAQKPSISKSKNFLKSTKIKINNSTSKIKTVIAKSPKDENSKEIAEKIKQIMHVSNRVKISTMKEFLNLEKGVFESQIFKWAEEFGFRIDGDEIVITEDDVEDFIEDLDEKYEEWQEHSDKKSNS